MKCMAFEVMPMHFIKNTWIFNGSVLNKIQGRKKVYTIFFVVFFLLIQLDMFSSPFQIILKLKFSEDDVRVEEVSLCFFLFQFLLFF